MAVERCVKPVRAALKALDSSEAKELAKSTKSHLSHLHQKKSQQCTEESTLIPGFTGTEADCRM